MQPWIRIRSHIFSFFWNSGSGLISSKRWNCDSDRGVMILPLGPGFGPSTKWNRSTSSRSHVALAVHAITASVVWRRQNKKRERGAMRSVGRFLQSGCEDLQSASSGQLHDFVINLRASSTGLRVNTKAAVQPDKKNIATGASKKT